ncbi:hypothetical protein GCM10028818_22720 [Spirosoma horti]
MNNISLKVREGFQEYLVANSVVRDIDALFKNQDIDPVDLDPTTLPNSVSRALVMRYYAALDWKNPKDLRKVLNIYEDLLECMDDRLKDPNPYAIEMESERVAATQQFERLKRWLEKDGYAYDGKKITFRLSSLVELKHEAVDLLDPFQFNEYVERINNAIEQDPALAIGSTKELVEAVLKTILTAIGGTIEKSDDVPRLLSKVQKALKLTPSDIDDASKGADIIKVLLSNLGQVVNKLAELRNLYGTGHGLEKTRKGLEPRHAKLAVGAGITLSTFLLDTFKARSV